jgi:ubiquinone/menaquinone biosynthesis C-methylase UbiE
MHQRIPTEADRVLEVYAERTEDRDRYSLRRPDVLYREQELERALVKVLPPLEGCKILEVGCGEGKWLRQLIRMGAEPCNLSGIDIYQSYVTRAAETLPQSVKLKVGNGENLEFADESLDLVFQFTCLTSVLNLESRRQMAREMVRVLRPGGSVIWYDMAVNNPNNKDIQGIGKDEIRNLFPGCTYRFRKLSIAAPIARKLGALAIQALQALKVLDTHYLAVITKSVG